MQYTAKEMVQSAKDLAQVTNSKAFSWSLLTSILNNAYSKLYNDLSGLSNSFIEYFTFTGSEADLPDDCNKILMVYEGNEGNPYILSQSSQNMLIPGTYYIENRVLKIVGKLNARKVTVKYSKLPVVLTAPDDDEVIDLNPATVGLCTDEGFYFKKSIGTNIFYFYDFENMSETEYTEGVMPTATDTFLGYTPSIVDDAIIWNGTDVTDYFLRFPDDSVDNISNTASDNTHLAVLYTNGDFYVMMSDWTKSQVNPVLYKGRFYNVQNLYGICADDSTGQYILVRQNDKLKKISFVPDTVIDYPDNVFFDIIIDKIAIQLQALQSLNNDALQTKLQEDEASFYGSLQRSQQGMRIRNDSNFYRRVWL